MCSSPATGPHLRATVDRLTGEILAAQEPSGYLNTYYVDDRKDKRFTEMYRSHELYCLGHLLQAAIAYYRATGNRKLLDGGIRFANYMIENFGPPNVRRSPGIPNSRWRWWSSIAPPANANIWILPAICLSGVERERLHLTDDQVQYHVQRQFRSRRARSSKVTPSAPCTRHAALPITTPRPATPPTGTRSNGSGKTWSATRCTSPAA